MSSSIKFSLFLICVTLFSCKKNTSNTSAIIPAYQPKDQALYDSILAMDKRYFDAYNTCDLETQYSIYDENIEFYHDQGGLETNKDTLIKALKDNICGKVTRQLVSGSMEVYSINGYGAVSEGYHTFYNKEEPDSPQTPSKFITIWRDTDQGWKMSRIVSLH